MDQNDIREGFLELVRAELSVYGVNLTQIKVDSKDEIYIEDHFVDQVVFKEKSEWPEKQINIRCYTVDYGRIIFMPDQSFYAEYRKREDLENCLDTQIDEVNLKIKELHILYLAQLADSSLDKTLDERIIPTLAKNYQITNSLSDVANWKVKIILGNNVNKNDPRQKGDFDSVGYVRIGLKTGTIVPIARGDEHNLGGDLIYYLINKQLIPNDLYYPVHYRNDYVSSDNTQALMAFKVWRKLGGPNIIIKNKTISSSDQNVFQVTIDDYIKAEGKITINKGELLPLGKELLQKLHVVSKLCIDARHDDRKSKRLFLEALKTYTFYLDKILVFYGDAQKELLNDIMKAESIGGEAGIQQVEQLFFGFDSFKNKLHMKVREALKELEKPSPFRWKVEEIEKIFGDLELANHELGNF